MSYSRNKTKAFVLAETQASDIGSAEARGIGKDGFENRLQLMRRASNGTQYFRDCRPVPDNFDQFLFQL